MIVTTRKVASKKLGVLLQSDIHIGGRHVDYDLIKKELEYAREHNLRINVNGDVFDAILPGDRKRFRMSVLHPRLANCGDRLISEAVDWAVEIYGPYADLIDMIGVGNHEEAVVKHHHIDPVEMLVERLNTDKHQIAHGGYSGWLCYRTKSRDLNIQYHHGAGGGGPVTKGIIQFNRSNTWIENADVVWRGHVHTKIYSKDRVMYIDRGVVKFRDRLNIITGAYGDDQEIQTQADVRKTGRHSSYAEERLLAPQGKGGYIIELDGNCITLTDRGF
jgi:hypothetical protein